MRLKLPEILISAGAKPQIVKEVVILQLLRCLHGIWNRVIMGALFILLLLWYNIINHEIETMRENYRSEI